MKKLVITNNGHPWSSQDMLHLQNAYSEILPGITETQIGKNAIISGLNMKLVNTTLSWTEGYVKFANEIFKVDAGTLAYSNSSYIYLEILQGTEKPSNTATTPYTVAYKNNTVQSVHIYRKMKPKIGPGTLGGPRLCNYIPSAGFYHDIYINDILNFQWVTAAFDIQAGNASGVVAGDVGVVDVMVRVLPNGFMEVRPAATSRGNGTVRTFWCWDIRGMVLRRFSNAGYTVETTKLNVNTQLFTDATFYTRPYSKYLSSTSATLTGLADAGGLTTVASFSAVSGNVLTQLNTSLHRIEWTCRRDLQQVFPNDVVLLNPTNQIIKVSFSSFS